MKEKRVEELNKLINSLSNDDLFFIIQQVENRIWIFDEEVGNYRDIESSYVIGDNVVLQIGGHNE